MATIRTTALRLGDIGAGGTYITDVLETLAAGNPIYIDAIRILLATSVLLPLYNATPRICPLRMMKSRACIS